MNQGKTVDKTKLIRGYKAGKDEGKPRFSLIPADVLKEVAKVFTQGAKKYDDRNFEKGIPYSELLDAMHRHWTDVACRTDIDPEWNLHHLAHLICDAMMMMRIQNLVKRGILEDRFDDREV